MTHSVRRWVQLFRHAIFRPRSATSTGVDNGAPVQPDLLNDVLAIHNRSTTAALAGGNANSIKELYSELGELLEETYADEPDVTVLSFPDTAPVVEDLL